MWGERGEGGMVRGAWRGERGRGEHGGIHYGRNSSCSWSVKQLTRWLAGSRKSETEQGLE